MRAYEIEQNLEQQETSQTPEEQKEAKETMGYSSDYYEHQMARALEKGNSIAYKNAKRDWANAKAKEVTGG